MKIQLPYGNSIQTLSYPNIDKFIYILPDKFAPISDPEKSIQESLENPLDRINLEILEGKRIGIAVNDMTRPVPNAILLPPLLDHLHKRGANKKDIYFFIASGTHKQTDKDEIEHIFPPSIIHEYSIYRHDCDDKGNLDYLGESTRNTPIYINKLYYQMDVKIVVGNIEPHHFMGYSGGAKSAAIGLASRETIRINHSHLLEKDSFIGNYENNPTRMDMEEIGDRIGITAALDVVLNAEKQIVHVLWGTPRGVMKSGVPISRQVCQKRIGDLYDLVIVSPGGYPKDINLYQAQKAITHVSLITRENGIIILVAECREGLGSNEFEEYLSQFSSLKDVVDGFQKSKFEIGPHKAYQLALQAIRNRIIIVSSINASVIKKTHLEYTNTLSDAMKLISDSIPASTKVAVVPYATNTMLY